MKHHVLSTLGCTIILFIGITILLIGDGRTLYNCIAGFVMEMAVLLAYNLGTME